MRIYASNDAFANEIVSSPEYRRTNILIFLASSDAFDAPPVMGNRVEPLVPVPAPPPDCSHLWYRLATATPSMIIWESNSSFTPLILPSTA